MNRTRAVDFIRREVEAARAQGLRAQLLVPLTRGHGDPALQFEIELTSLDQLETFRHRGVGSDRETGTWMHSFSEILTAPPLVEILKVDENPDLRSARPAERGAWPQAERPAGALPGARVP